MGSGRLVGVQVHSVWQGACWAWHVESRGAQGQARPLASIFHLEVWVTMQLASRA